MSDDRPDVRRATARRLAAAAVVLLAVAAVVGKTRAPAAQPDTRIPWIGYLANEPTPDSAPIFRDALRERSWVEGQSVKIWYRYAQGKPDFYPQHADDLVRLNVNAIVAVGPEAIEAARRATKTIPVVMVSLDDPAELVREAAAPSAISRGSAPSRPRRQRGASSSCARWCRGSPARRCCGALTARARPPTCRRPKPRRPRAAWS